MFEMQEADGSWITLDAQITHQGRGTYSVVVSGSGVGSVSMFDDRPCRLSGRQCRQVSGTRFNMNPPYWTLVLLVLA